MRERLAISLSLDVGGTTYTIPGGCVAEVELELRSHGFIGVVEFVQSDDKSYGGSTTDSLRDAFLGQDLIELTASIEASYASPQTSDDLQPIQVKGLVMDKAVTEEVFRQTGDLPILWRRYRLSFADPARVLWTQHYPCELYTSKTVQAVIDAHKGDKISITYDWDEVTEEKPMFFVHLPPERGASFYDWVVWYTDANAGIFGYDYTAGGYTLRGEKDTTGTANSAFGDDFATVQIVLPAVPRYQPMVLNSYSESPTSQSITQDQAATGITHQHLMRSSIAQDADDRVTVETSRMQLPSYRADIELARYPTIDMTPGALFEISASARWSADSALIGKTWRVRWLTLSARAGELGAKNSGDRGEMRLDDIDSSTDYELTMHVRAEQSDEPRPDHPVFQRPCYPGFFEGKVKSEQGEDTDKTYNTYTNATTSLTEYKVVVPLWSSQEITAPFEPYWGSGNVYIPAYRDARVLIEMGLEQGRIRRLLDWRDGAPLSMDVQGEQILFGKSGANNTSINHVYDDANPVFNVARTHDSDTSLIQLKEGALYIEVKETSGG